LGEHQVKNAVVALETALILARKGYDRICESSVRKGLADAKWPGRLEILKKEPIFLIDGAHNAEGAKTLSEFLKTYFPGKKIVFIILCFQGPLSGTSL